MKPRVFVTRVLPKEAMDRINVSCDAKVWGEERPPPREVLLENIRDIEGLLCLLTDKIDAELLGRALRLRVISNYAVGYDNIDVVAATQRGIVIGNTPGVLTETVADFTIALMTTAARRIVEGDKQVRTGRWKTWGPMILLGQDIHNATLGIIGLGRIGIAVARRAKGFGMKVLYYDLTRRNEIENTQGIEYTEFDRILAESDFISLHANLTPETYHFIAKEQLGKMKRTCVLVNTARGQLVDSMALYEALRNNKIAFAALDVTEPEPLPTNHPLLTLDNVIVTPHIASASVATRTKMALMAVDNLIAGLNGEMPPNPVNPEVLRKA
ncbi:MAG: D-glycerate dehydrogenase [Candidatus Bathyarchaeia archaeon]|jgi:glyoxylate reductase